MSFPLSQVCKANYPLDGPDLFSLCALHRKLTDAEKKVIDKIDEALNTTVTRTAQFVGLLDGTAGTMDLVGDVLGMTW